MEQTSIQTLSPEKLKAACALYNIDHQDITLLKNSTNLIYSCEDKILKIIHSSTQGITDLETELDWIRFLHQQDICVANFIPSQNGNAYERMNIDNAAYYLVAGFHRIDGKRISHDNWNTDFFQQLGRFVGQLHQSSKQYKPAKNIYIKQWHELSKTKVLSGLSKSKHASQIQQYHQLIQQINTFPITPENYGMIHYDIHQGNYQITENGQIALFDFELCCQSWFINDIAVVLYYALQFPTKEKRTPKQFADLFMPPFLKGYTQEKSIREEDLQQIKPFLQLRHLVLVAYIQKLWQDKTLNEGEQRFADRLQSLTEDNFEEIVFD